MQGPPQVIALPPGSLLNEGRYRIQQERNRGGTAVVYSAEDLHHPGHYVALKVMNGPETVPIKVVKREIAFSAQANHSNIVKLLDVFADGAKLVIVWELISGPDLLDLVNEHEGRLPEPMAAFFFCQLLQAAQFMHNNGFCHRDIKPENCMVQRANHQLKLIDFGLSKHLASAKTLGVGTPDYLSPEMLQVGVGGPASGYDARAVDAWAMGVMLYLLCTGKYPYESPEHPNNLSHTIHNVLSGRIQPFPATMSPGCQALIQGLLQTNPAQRTTLDALARNEWLLGQAQAHAKQVGRMDLLAPLLERAAQPATAAAAQPKAKPGPTGKQDGQDAAQAIGVDAGAAASADAGGSAQQAGGRGAGHGGRRPRHAPVSLVAKVCAAIRRRLDTAGPA